MERETRNKTGSMLKLAVAAVAAIIGLIMFKSMPQMRRYLRMKQM